MINRIKILLKRKSKYFWYCFFTLLFLILYITFRFLYDFIPVFFENTLYRIPYINNNIEIIVKVENRDELKKFKKGTPIYIIQPELYLIGFVSKIEKDFDNSLKYYLSIGQKFKFEILREDTKFEFITISPSLWLAIKRFLKGQNKVEFQNDLKLLAKKNKFKIIEMFKRLSLILGQELKDQKLANKILADKKLREKINKEIEKEIIKRIDWNKILESIENNKNTKNIVNLLKDNINWEKIAYNSFKKGINGAIDEGASFIINPKYFSNDKGGNLIKTFFSFISLALNPKNTIRNFKKGFKKEAFRQSWKETKIELKKVIKKHKTKILKNSIKVISNVGKEIKISNKIVNVFNSLAHNKLLLNYIKERYGIKVQKAFIRTFLKASNDTQLQNYLDNISKDIQIIIKKWLEKFFLNKNKTGPNPYLLMALKDNIFHKPEPQILCFPGIGLKVNSPYVYKGSIMKYNKK